VTNEAAVNPRDLPLPLDSLPGITPHRLELLGKLGITTLGELLLHLPRGYVDLSDQRPITALTPGEVQTVQGEIVELDSRSLPTGGFVASAVISDDGVTVLEGVWFNQPYATRRFRYGQRVAFTGKPRWYRDHWQMSNPHVQILEGSGPTRPGVLPIYPLTEDLRADVLRSLIARAVDLHAAAVPDCLPPSLRQREGWPSLAEALRQIHCPTSLAETAAARQRLLYEQLFVLQTALALRRRELSDRQQAPRLPVTPLIDERIRRLFPFRLTQDQNRAIAEVCADLAKDRPMQRLLQADVGAGKTAVAVYALLVAVANKYQAALMAPTEVLARQHAHTLDRYLAHSRVRRVLLTGALTARERREALEGLRQGQIDLVVGTQALAQEGIAFARLGLVVVDEQHKFGVHQRARLRRLGHSPHYLVMTATPIPRTVTLTVFGDLDLTLMRELPPGRQPVVTRWLDPSQRDWLYQQLQAALAEGRQAYVVCPLVEDTGQSSLRSASSTYKELCAGPLRDYAVGLLHGQQEEEVKADIMERFRRREIDVLVSTSVVEVGVDVPNATWMIVEDAERFGLSQLHQLRGRVSRGTSPGFCYLFANPAGDEAAERLRVFLRTSDGFTLAEEDARLRGAGELFGTRQHGTGEIVDLGPGGLQLLERARRDAFEVVAADPQLARPEHAALRRAVFEQYGETLELPEVG
jgi:ATP-dependent DNA helicase RecG